MKDKKQTLVDRRLTIADGGVCVNMRFIASVHDIHADLPPPYPALHIFSSYVVSESGAEILSLAFIRGRAIPVKLEYRSTFFFSRRQLASLYQVANRDSCLIYCKTRFIRHSRFRLAP